MDLNSAAAAYDDYIDRIETFLRTASLEHSLVASTPPWRRRAGEANYGLAVRRVPRGFCDTCLIVTATRSTGPTNPDAHGDSLAEMTLVRQVLETYRPVCGTIVLDAKRLAMEGPGLSPSTGRIRPAGRPRSAASTPG